MLRHFPLHARQQAFDPLVHIRERVLTQNCPLRLIIQFQVHPINREIPATFLGAFDEVSPQLGSSRLRRHLFRLEHLSIVGDAGCEPFTLQQIEQPSLATDVVLREIELGNADIIEGEIMLFHVSLEQSLLDHPVDLGLHTTEVLRLHGLQSALPQIHHAIDHGVGS